VRAKARAGEGEEKERGKKGRKKKGFKINKK
jgi:hypothetical protein